jgi:glycosyltransferase involved in cell wall biosynthesis
MVYGNTRQTFYAIDAAKWLGLPSVWNPRESESWQTYFEFLAPEIAERALQCFAYPYRVVFVADATRESCAPLDTHHNFVTIHTGLDRGQFLAALAGWPRAEARRELGVGADELVALMVGTVCERKGQIDLIEAVARLDDGSASRTKCFVVGDRANEYSARLERARAALPAARRARIEIVAETSDIARYYAASDVFVCASRFESFPRVILEAMAAGLPIVTTPVYGIAEQVRENVNALCYAPGDVETLARHLERLHGEPQLRRTLAANSSHVLDLLNDYESMLQAYAEVFREAWASGASR